MAIVLNRIQIFNHILRVIAAVNLLYAVYNMYKSEIPKEVLPVDSAFSGKFKYLTFWSLCLEAIYFVYAILESLLSGCSDNEKKPLRKVRDYYFMSAVFPLSSFVTFTFWALFAVDRELVMPKSVDKYFPTWLNHSVHSLNFVYAFLELLSCYHKSTSSLLTQSYLLWFITILYVFWCHVVYWKSEIWVYPILEQFNLACRLLFFFGCLCLSSFFLVVGYYLSNKIWKEKSQKKSLQIDP